MAYASYTRDTGPSAALRRGRQRGAAPLRRRSSGGPLGLGLRLGRKFALAAALAALVAAFTPPACRGQWTYFENHSDLRALWEDGDVLWVATNGGVLLVSVLTGDLVSTIDATEGLPSNSTRALLGRGGAMYIGTDGGLNACRTTEARRVSCDASGAYRDIRALDVGRSETLYVGTFGHGVAEVRGARVRWTTTADSLLDNKVYAVREGSGGAVFFATSMGLCARMDTVWVSYQAGAGLPRGEVRALLDVGGPDVSPDRTERAFYVLVEGRGVYYFDGRRARGILRRGLFREDDVAAIAVAGDGTLWAVGRHGGAAHYRDGVWTVVGEGDDDIASARWRCVHVGRSGRVYLGSADGLLAAVAEGEIRKVFIPYAVPTGRAGPMIADPSGRTYVAMGAYLLSLESDTSGFGIEKDFGSVLAIAVSPDSAVWVAGRWGLYTRRSGRWAETVPDIDPRSPRFRSLTFDPSGRLWAGAESGEIFRYDGELWIRCADEGELSHAGIEQLVADRRGTIWALSESGLFASRGSGWDRDDIARFDSTGAVDLTVNRLGEPVLLTRRHLWVYGEGTGWRLAPSPSPEDVGEYRTIGFDGEGRTYLGTKKGVALIDSDRPRWVGAGDGLRGLEVTSVLLDGDGYLWVGFQKDGISRILLENLW